MKTRWSRWAGRATLRITLSSVADAKTLDEKLEEMIANSEGNTLLDVQTEELVNTLAHTPE